MDSESSSEDTVYLVSCVGMKRAEPAPARELYISPWFKGVRELVERSGLPWFILSAEHGLVSPNEILAPYERTLNTMGKEERRAWARRVQAQMEQRLPGSGFSSALAPNASFEATRLNRRIGWKGGIPDLPHL